MNDYMSIIAIAVALAVFVALVILYKKRVIDADMISGVNEIMQELPVVEGSGVFAAIHNYAKIAVKTVDQLVKTGAIDRDDEARKNAAMDIVANAARVDGVPYGQAEMDVASACIEAEVYDLPRNQKPPDTAEA